MAGVETSTRKIVRRLKSDGWVDAGGGKHDKFEHPERPDVVIIVPRQTTQKPGTARSIAKAAGWL